MINYLKIVLKFFLVLAICTASLSPTECQKPRIQWKDEDQQTNHAYPPPDSNSSSASNYNNYNNYRLMMEEVLLTKEAYPGTDYYKNNDISIKLGIISNKDYSLINTRLFDRIEKPFNLDIDSFQINRGPDSEKLNLTLIDSNESFGTNQKFNTTNNYILNLSKNRELINLTIKQLNKSEMLYLCYNISTNCVRKYSLQPCKLVTYDFFEGTKVLQSNPLYIDILDHNPLINNFKIKPNPAATYDKIHVQADIEDLDEKDLKKCELFSSIDGSLPLDGTESCSNGTYSYKFSKNLIEQLSEGDHLITIRVFDKENRTAEETLTLKVDRYLLWIIPYNYIWAIGSGILIGIVIIFIELAIKNRWKK